MHIIYEDGLTSTNYHVTLSRNAFYIVLHHRYQLHGIYTISVPLLVTYTSASLDILYRVARGYPYR